MKKVYLYILTALFIGNSMNISATSLAFDPSKPRMIKVTEGVYQFQQNFYNSLVVITEEGVVVSDPSKAERAKAMRDAIREITDQPVVKVIYSHDHFDHSRGGEIFKREGAEFIAHKACLELMSRDLEQQVVLPDTTYELKHQIKLGDKTIDLHYYGPNDGNCMSVVHMPDDKVLLAVDWHLQGYVNESYRLPAHNYIGVLRTMERVRAELEFEHIISGHMPISSVEQFEEDYQFNKALFEAVWKGMQAGKQPKELAQTIKLPQFKHWRGYDKNLPAHIERMAYSIWHGN